MKEKQNYKSKKTLIIGLIIVALVALAGTGIYVFTKGNDESKAMPDNETTIIVDENGDKVAVDENGEVVGRVDEEGNITPIDINNQNSENTTETATTNTNNNTTRIEERVVEDTTTVQEEVGTDGLYLSWEKEEIDMPLLQVEFKRRAATVIINKVDSVDETIKLEGAEFNLSGISEIGTNIDITETTDSNGSITFKNVPYGTYNLTETKAPEGYCLPTQNEMSIDISDSQEQTYTLKNDKIAGTVGVNKFEQGNASIKLEGASFKLTGTSVGGMDVERTGTTDKNGLILWEDMPAGQYTIEELEAPVGYEKTTQKGYAVIYDGAAIVGFANKLITGNIIIDKVDSVTGEKLEGAEFTLTGTSILGKEISLPTTTTDMEGQIKWENVPLGTYTVKEVKAPEGYQLAPEQTVVISAKDETKTLKFEDEKIYGTIIINKVDKDDISIKLEGAKFSLTGTSAFGDQIAITGTTNADGKITWDNIPYGTYTVKEEEAPDGYNKADDQTAKIETQDQTVELTFEDEPLYATFLGYGTSNNTFKKVINRISNNQTNSITAFIRSETLEGDYEIISDSSKSNTPIYAWYEDGKVYWYTNAKDIYFNSDCRNLFSMKNLSDISSLKDINTSRVENMSFMFSVCNNLEDLSALRDWDVSNVTNMSGMFWWSLGLKDISPLANWDVSNVTVTERMFYKCEELENISSLANWNVSNVTDMQMMFYYCNSLTDISALENWDVSNVTKMSDMFAVCENITDISPLTNWDVSSVTNMSGMFASCYSLKDTSALANWDVSNVTYMGNMFYGCKSLTDISALANWDVSNVTSMFCMFGGLSFTGNACCENLTDISPLANWDVSNVTNMAQMFESCINLTDISALANWDVSSVTDMSNMFCGCKNLTNISSLANWSDRVSNVTRISALFSGCENLTDITPLKDWDVSSVTDMMGVFSDCKNLINISPLSNWGDKVSNVTDMQMMFADCRNLTDITPIKDWDVSNVTSMMRMFLNCLSLRDLSALKDWDVTNVRSFAQMAASCPARNSGFSFTKLPGSFNSSGTYIPSTSGTSSVMPNAINPLSFNIAMPLSIDEDEEEVVDLIDDIDAEIIDETEEVIEVVDEVIIEEEIILDDNETTEDVIEEITPDVTEEDDTILELTEEGIEI